MFVNKNTENNSEAGPERLSIPEVPDVIHCAGGRGGESGGGGGQGTRRRGLSGFKRDFSLFLADGQAKKTTERLQRSSRRQVGRQIPGMSACV